MGSAPSQSELQEIVDRLADSAGIDTLPVELVPGSLVVGLDRPPERRRIVVGEGWWRSLERQGLCETCSHSSFFHTPTCSIREGCSCETFIDDGSDKDVLRRETLEAMLAHEIGHQCQDLEAGRIQEETPAGNYDADERAVIILAGKPEQVIRALRMNAPAMRKPSTTHGPTEERVRRIQERRVFPPSDELSTEDQPL
jgi:hypothetical protein